MGKKVKKRELAEILGTSERTLTDWQKDDSFPYIRGSKRGQANTYDTADVIQWWLARDAGDEYEGNYNAERTRLAKAQADKTEIEVSVLLGELIAKEMVERIIISVTTNFRSKMLAIPSKLSSVLAGETKAVKVRKKINLAIIDALDELSSLDANVIIDSDGVG